MATIEKLNSSLPTAQAAFIDAQVEAGSFSRLSEMVASYDRWQADTGSGLTPQDMAVRMRRRHEARLKVQR